MGYLLYGSTSAAMPFKELKYTPPVLEGRRPQLSGWFSPLPVDAPCMRTRTHQRRFPLLQSVHFIIHNTIGNGTTCQEGDMHLSRQFKLLLLTHKQRKQKLCPLNNYIPLLGYGNMTLSRLTIPTDTHISDNCTKEQNSVAGLRCHFCVD